MWCFTVKGLMSPYCEYSSTRLDGNWHVSSFIDTKCFESLVRGLSGPVLIHFLKIQENTYILPPLNHEIWIA